MIAFLTWVSVNEPDLALSVAVAIEEVAASMTATRRV